MSRVLRGFLERGEMNEALGALAAVLGLPPSGKIDFNTEFDPRHDLIWEGAASRPEDRRKALALIRAAGRKGGSEPDLLTLEGAVHVSYGDLSRARRALESAVAREPSSSPARLWQFRVAASEALRAKEFDRLKLAVELSEGLGRGHAGIVLLHAWRAQLYTGFDLHPQALADLEQVLKLKPDCGWAYAEIADIRTTRHRLEEAIEACGRLIALHPDQGWAYCLRGRTWGKCGRIREALDDLDRAIEMGPPMGSMFSWRGEARRRAGDLKGALQDFGRAERLDPGYPFTYLWRGAARLRLGRLAAAVSDLSRSIRLDPRNLLAFAWRGEALIKLGRLKEGLRDFDRFHPSNPRETWNGGPSVFLNDLRKVAAARPRDPLARALLGRFLLEDQASPPGRAMEEFDAAILGRPRDGWTRAWRAQALERMGRPEEARKDMDAAVRLRPGWSWAWAWRGRARLEAGNVSGALNDLDRSLSIDPIQGEVHAWRARALLQGGRAEEARRSLERAAALGYREVSKEGKLPERVGEAAR